MRLPIPILAAVLLLASLGVARGDASADFERAMRAISAGDYAAATTHFTKIIKAGELDAAGLAVVYQNRGHSFLALKHFDAAIGDFNRALSLRPKYAEAYYGRGMALAAKHQNKAAVENFEAAIALKPDFAPSYGERGQVLLRLGRHDDALLSLEDAIRFGSDDWRVYNDRGIIMLARSDLQGAFQSFDAAIGVAPENSVPYRNRGIVYLLQGQLPLAGFDLEQALKYGPGDLETVLWRTVFNTYVALDVGADITKYTTEKSIRAWPGPLLEMFLGKDVPAAVLETGETQFARGPAKLLAQTRYIVAIYYLSQGDQQAAIELFEKVVAMGTPTLFEYHAARRALEWQAGGK